jgi:mono/diheme cytochrome c family protein
MSPPTSTPSAEAKAAAGRPGRRPARLAWLAAGVALALALFGAGGLLVVEGGLFDATAITPHRAIVGWAAHTAMIKAVRRTAGGIQAPAGFTAAQVTAGFRIYDQRCAMCHGGPGVPRADWTTGLTPTPPYLLDAARQWTPAQLRVIVGDGVKMTAMPAWSTTLSEAEVWDVVAFLEDLPDLSAADYARLRAAAPPAASPARAAPAPGSAG